MGTDWWVIAWKEGPPSTRSPDVARLGGGELSDEMAAKLYAEYQEKLRAAGYFNVILLWRDETGVGELEIGKAG